MIRFHKLALGAAFVATLSLSPSYLVGNVGEYSIAGDAGRSGYGESQKSNEIVPLRLSQHFEERSQTACFVV